MIAEVTTTRGSASARCRRIRTAASSCSSSASARSAAARTLTSSSCTIRATVGIQRLADARAGQRQRPQRARAHARRLVLEQERRDQMALVERLEHLDRVEHGGFVGMRQFLDERLDRRRIGDLGADRPGRNRARHRCWRETRAGTRARRRSRCRPRRRSSPGWRSSDAASPVRIPTA